MPQPAVDPVRRAALTLLTDVTVGGRLLPEKLAERTEGLDSSGRARAARLATETLRWAQRADRLLGPHLRNRPEDQVMNALRMALVEIHVMDTPDHAAVHAAVALCQGSKAGLVNAVLRNVQRTGTDWDALPVPSLPKWLRKPLVAAWGKDDVAEMERVFASRPPLDLTPRDGDADSLAERLGGTPTGTGSVRLASGVQVSALPGFEEGDWWVQDAAATIPAQCLGVAAGERVLDLCAAPGGKTLQLAARGAQVTALDVSEARLARVHENLARTGLTAEVVTADALEWTAEPFDAVLLDAPCSATGTLRRHPDLAHAKSVETIEGLPALQDALIDRAVALTKPGGRVVFCTCSVLPEEGEERREAALARHPELSPDADAIPAHLARPEWDAGSGALRLRPDHWADRGGLDGFFIAAFRRA